MTYDDILADLRAKRDQVEQAILAIEELQRKETPHHKMSSEFEKIRHMTIGEAIASFGIDYKNTPNI